MNAGIWGVWVTFSGPCWPTWLILQAPRAAGGGRRASSGPGPCVCPVAAKLHGQGSAARPHPQSQRGPLDGAALYLVSCLKYFALKTVNLFT